MNVSNLLGPRRIVAAEPGGVGAGLESCVTDSNKIVFIPSVGVLLKEAGSVAGPPVLQRFIFIKYRLFN